MPHLTIDEQGSQRVHQLEGDYATIGRAPSNAITLDEAKASKEHARLQSVGARWKLIDLESKNGTRVNGDFCNKAWLESGDVIRIGTTELSFTGGERAGGRRSIAREQRRMRDEAVKLTPAAAASLGDGPPAGGVASGEAPLSTRERGEESAGRASRYRDPADDWIKWGLIGIGVVVILVIVNIIGSKAAADPHNVKVIKAANKMLADRNWEGAIRYLRANGDPDGNGYAEVERRIRELQERKPEHERIVNSELAAKLVSKLGNRIKMYHRGKDQLTSPEDVLALVKQLETECAGTDHYRQARETWPAWFSGKVPERGSELVGDRYRRPWEAMVEKADGYRKEGYFREAQETVLKFLSTREAVMDADALVKYRALSDQLVDAYQKSAASHYYDARQRADRLIRNRRYDQAKAAFQEVVDRSGIEEYVRKARAEILKIESLKASDKAPPETPSDGG